MVPILPSDDLGSKLTELYAQFAAYWIFGLGLKLHPLSLSATTQIHTPISDSQVGFMPGCNFFLGMSVLF